MFKQSQFYLFSLMFRACGEGFCHECSDFKRPVPERGWGMEEPVRVCRECYGPLATKPSKIRERAPTKVPSPVTPHPKDDRLVKLLVQNFTTR